MPIVGQYQHELESQAPRLGERVIQTLKTIRPIVEDGVLKRRVPSLEIEPALRAVAVDTADLAVQRTAVDEAPGAHDLDAHRACALEYVIDHRLGRVGQVVVVGPREAKWLA